jgi:hypothetical protein
MTAADRTRRQHDIDHATRPARVEAVTRDLLADLDYYNDTKETK